MECPTCAHALPEGAVFCPICGERLPDAVECEDYAYEAFISYRHVPQDERVARRIQRRIEGFRIPSELRTADLQRLGKCFRDEDELPTSGSLPTMLEDALRRSRRLIVICSPQMRESKWVAREVELFAALHGRDRILLALADGEPDASFPPLLMTRVRREGPKLVTQDMEPVAADLRPSARRHFSNEALRLIAPLVGCGYDDLRQRERARRMRRLAAAACVVAVVTAAFAAFALFQQAQIQANYEAALRRQSEYLADEAGDLLTEGNRTQAAQVALYALGEGDGEERPYVPAARLALEQACQVYPGDFWRSGYANPSDAGIASLADVHVSSDGSLYTVLDSDDGVTIYDVPTGNAVAAIDAPPTTGSRHDIGFAGNLLVCLDSGHDGYAVVRAYDPTSGERAWETSLELGASDLTVSPDESLIAVGFVTSMSPDPTPLCVLSAADGSVLSEFTLEPPAEERLEWTLDENPAAFTEDSSLFMQAWGPIVYVVDVRTGETRTLDAGLGSITSLLVDDGSLYLSAFRELDPTSEYVLGAFDLPAAGALSTAPRWTYADVANGSISDPIMPRLAEVFTGEDQRSHLLAMLNDDLVILAASDGIEELDLETDGQLTAAHVFGEAALFYVSDGTIRMAPDIVNSTGANNSRITGGGFSAPTTYGGGAEVGSSGIRFFTGEDGVRRCLLADPDRTVVYQLDYPYELPGQESLPEGALDTLGEGDPDRISVNGDYLFFYDSDTGMLHVSDGQTFDQLTTIDLAAIANTDKDSSLSYAPSAEFDDLLYVSRESTLYAVELPSGAVVGTLEGASRSSLSYATLECHDGTVRFIASNDDLKLEIVTVDARTLEERSRVPLSLDTMSSSVRDVGTLGDTVLLATEEGIVVADAQTGELMQTELAGFQAERHRGTTMGQSVELGLYRVSDPDAYFTFDETHEHLLVCDGSGTLAQYGADGEKDWEFEAGSLLSGPANFLAYLPSGRVFVQCTPEAGRAAQCVLLDADTGEMLASSLDTPAIGRAWVSSDGTTLYARSSSYTVAQLSDTFVDGIFLVNLDPDAFGMESQMYLAVLVTPNEDRALFYDQMQHEYFTLPLYSTDELIAHANELVEGHELTGAEQRLYHLT